MSGQVPAGTMRCLVAPAPGQPLREEARPLPVPRDAEVLLQVLACAVCRTDLHVLDGELPQARYPVVPGHQAVGRVVAAGPRAELQPGDWAGACWLAWTCGRCEYCLSGRENLCPEAQFHGCQRDGGFATHMVADSRWCVPLAPDLRTAAATPLLCAGLIGFRTLRAAGNARRIGVYGFGSAGHLVAQLARSRGQEVYAFTRPGDDAARRFALDCGVRWAGDATTPAPVALDAALIFAPAGELVPKALRDVKPGGTVVCGGIHMSDIPRFPYADLWGERVVRSIANLTRQDAADFLALTAGARPAARTICYPLQGANDALGALRHGTLSGTAVLLCDPDLQANP
jgi:propanol-preferring alcohol dehydrogenase